MAASPPPPPPGALDGVQVRSLLRLRGVLLLGVAGGLHLQATCWLSWPVRATLSRHQLLHQALQERSAVRPLGPLLAFVDETFESAKKMTEPQKEKLAEKLSKKRGVGNILNELADVQFPAEAKTNKDKVRFIVANL